MSVKSCLFGVFLGCSLPLLGHADTFSQALDTCAKATPKNELQQYRCMENVVLTDGQYHPSAIWVARMWLTSQVVQLATKKSNKQITDAAYDAAIANVTNVYSQISVLADMADKRRAELEQKAVSSAANQAARVANTGVYRAPMLPLPRPSAPITLPSIDGLSDAPTRPVPVVSHYAPVTSPGLSTMPPAAPAPGSLLPRTYTINTWGNTATVTGPNGVVRSCVGGYGGTVTCN
ncbi:hypothetical protein [Acetobacter pasteurianus]|uniref:hypothetical protein n=1 Tax=Acetobacter pasteurianus TaxID=438 RepID=UPI003D11CE45